MCRLEGGHGIRGSWAGWGRSSIDRLQLASDTMECTCTGELSTWELVRYPWIRGRCMVFVASLGVGA